jgi:hypothetical protein
VLAVLFRTLMLGDNVAPGRAEDEGEDEEEDEGREGTIKTCPSSSSSSPSPPSSSPSSVVVTRKEGVVLLAGGSCFTCFPFPGLEPVVAATNEDEELLCSTSVNTSFHNGVVGGGKIKSTAGARAVAFVVCCCCWGKGGGGPALAGLFCFPLRLRSCSENDLADVLAIVAERESDPFPPLDDDNDDPSPNPKLGEIGVSSLLAAPPTPSPRIALPAPPLVSSPFTDGKEERSASDQEDIPSLS